MKKEYYFVVSIFSRERNMKEKMLGEWLSSFKDSLFEFNEEFTPDDLQTLLKNVLMKSMFQTDEAKIFILQIIRL